MAVILEKQKEVDKNSGIKLNVEIVDGKLQLKVIGKIGDSDKNIVPVMTSNNSPSPYIASASSVYIGSNETYGPWRAFDGNYSTGWSSYRPIAWLKIYLGEGKIVNKYAITSDGISAPRSWLFQGSNDDINWITLHTVKDATSWNNERRVYYVDYYSKFKYYRISITSNNGSLISSSINEFELFEENIPIYNPYGTCEYGPIDLGFYSKEIKSIQAIKEIPIGSKLNIYTSTSTDNINFSEWALVDKDGNITSPQGRYIKIKIELIGRYIEDTNAVYTFDKSKKSLFEKNDFIEIDKGEHLIINSLSLNQLTAAINTPKVSSIIIVYGELDKKYSGLMFMDTSQQYYSTSFGEILKYLDFGTMISGQTSLDVKVYLTNTLPFDVKNIRIYSEHNIDGLTVELSKSNMPFIAENELFYDQVLGFDEVIEFYVRLTTDKDKVGGGTFDIKVKADAV